MSARDAATGRRSGSTGGGGKGHLPKEQVVRPGRVARQGQGETHPEGYQKMRPDTPAPEGTKIPGF
jgi:hypothetical protein